MNFKRKYFLKIEVRHPPEKKLLKLFEIQYLETRGRNIEANANTYINLTE